MIPRTKKKGHVVVWGEEIKYEDYLNHWAWKEKAEWIKHIRNNRCERCGDKKYLHVHHKDYKSLGNETKDDVEVLCKDCHKKEHGII